MVFVIAGVRSFVGGGLRVLMGGLHLGQLIIIMLIARQRILYSVSRLDLSACLPVRDQGCRPEERKEFLRMTRRQGILICSGEVFKLCERCYYILPQSCLRNALFAMPGLDFADGN